MENSKCIGHSSTDEIPYTGGSIGYSYGMTNCQGAKEVLWEEEGSAEEIEWFVVTFPEAGKMVVTAGNNTGKDKSVNLVPYYLDDNGNKVYCGNQCILVSQRLSCTCTSIETIGFTKNIPQEGVDSNAKIEIGEYVLSDGCKDTLLSFTSEDSLVLSVENNKIYVSGYIAPNESDDPKTFNIKILYNQSECKTLTLTQDGETPCDCTHAVEYRLHTLRKSFKDAGTGDEKDMIASAHTSCGSISATTEGCEMINEGDLTTEYDGNGNFYFYVKVKPREDLSKVRSCTINFHFKKAGEYSVYSKCAAFMTIIQDGTYCRCENISDFELISSEDNFRWAEEVKYTPSEHSSTGCNWQPIGRLNYKNNGNTGNCVTYQISNVTPEDAALIYNRDFVCITNNVSNQQRTIRGEVSVVSDFSTGDAQVGKVGNICDTKTFEVTQEGLPTCTCADLGITFWGHSGGGFYKIEGYNIELEYALYGQEVYFSSECFDYYIDSKEDEDYGRWTIDKTNTANWLTVSKIGSACYFGSDNIGYTQVRMNGKVEEDRETTFDLVYDDGKNPKCAKTITIKQKGSSPAPSDCNCNKYNVTSQSFYAPGVTDTVLIYFTKSLTDCPRSDYEYKFLDDNNNEIQKPDWITNLSKGEYGLIGNLSPNETDSERRVKVKFYFEVDGNECDNLGYISQDGVKKCDDCYAIDESNTNFNVSRNWDDYEFASGGESNVTIGFLNVRYNPNVLDRSCVKITAKPQDAGAAYCDIVSFNETDRGRELIINVKPNTTEQPQTFRIDINISVDEDNCFYHGVTLKVSGAINNT